MGDDNASSSLHASFEAILLAKHETLQTEWQEQAAFLIAENFALKSEVASLRKKLKDATSEKQGAHR